MWLYRVFQMSTPPRMGTTHHLLQSYVHAHICAADYPGCVKHICPIMPCDLPALAMVCIYKMPVYSTYIHTRWTQDGRMTERAQHGINSACGVGSVETCQQPATQHTHPQFGPSEPASGYYYCVPRTRWSTDPYVDVDYVGFTGIFREWRPNTSLFQPHLLLAAPTLPQAHTYRTTTTSCMYQ